MKREFSIDPINLFITIEGSGKDAYLRLHYSSKYAGGSIPMTSVKEVISTIEDVCGKGSYVLYRNKARKYASAVNYYESSKLSFPKITYWMQGVKTNLIEVARDAMIEAWGESKETEIGWLEKECRSYIEDIK